MPAGRAVAPVALAEVCKACGSVPGVAASEHPLVEGAICADCRGCLLETFFSCQDDGTFDHCVICGRTGHLVVCDVSSCNRCFCVGCIQRLVHRKELEKVLAASPWWCYLCSGRAVGLLRCRPDWQQRLLELFRPPGPRCPPPPVPLEEERRPIRVLSLFDGIGTGRYVLDQIGIAVEAYFASEVDQGAINVGITQHGTGISYLGPVESVTDAQIQALCPVDLLLAGSPCNDLSLVNPARKGLYGQCCFPVPLWPPKHCSGSGALFFDFHRLLRAVQLANRGHHLFWVYENVAAMPRDCKRTISRFLEVEKIRTVTTRSNSLRQGKQGMLPVQVGERGADVLWITELERVFGFPSHYTDVGNLSLGRRQQLLGRAWSVPVVCHLLGPLKDFFRAGERRPPTREC